MIVVMQDNSTEKQLNDVLTLLESQGFQNHIVKGTEKTIIGAVGDKSRDMSCSPETMPGVEKVIPVLAPYKLASRQFKQENTQIKIANIIIGGPEIQVMAGPCAIESEEQLLETAHLIKEAGGRILRGGAYKPRTSPYSFQGYKEKGLKILDKARKETGLLIVTEAVDINSLDLVAQYSDIIQIGSRNMHNYSLLEKAAKKNKPILLKRGLSSTIEEWILAAEYILKAGNHQVIMCERGIRTYEPYTRNTLDLSAVPLIKQLTHLPIIVDPSHGTGKWRLVQPMAQAAVAAGADGLMIEVHPEPSKALSDGPQSLTPENFSNLMVQTRQLSKALGRMMHYPDSDIYLYEQAL